MAVALAIGKLSLHLRLIGDWILETAEPVQKLIDDAGLGKVTPTGTANIQVVPSGPGQTADGLLQMILGLINAAQRELVLTTPFAARVLRIHHRGCDGLDDDLPSRKGRHTEIVDDSLECSTSDRTAVAIDAEASH